MQNTKNLTLHSGDAMPAIGLGTWKSEPGEVLRAVKEAVRVGYRHIDCAWIYGNEAEIGQALSELFEEGVVTRDEVWITSKLWNNRHAPEDVEGGLRETLEALRLDSLDLYLIHWPVAFKRDAVFPEGAADTISLEEQPLIDTWRAMEALVDKGLCRNIGVSNFSVPKLEGVLAEARIKPAINQVELHPYLQQPALLAFCQAQNVHLTAYSPLGSRDRPERLRQEDDPVLLDDPVIAEIAAGHGVSPAQVLIGWALARGTIVIPKSVNPGRIKQNLDAVAVAEVLTAEEMAQIAALDRGRRYVNGWSIEGSSYSLATLWDV